MEKVEGTEKINVCIERVFGYKAHVNRMFLNISQLLEITEKERNELLLLVKNLQELGSSHFPYIALIRVNHACIPIQFLCVLELNLHDSHSYSLILR